MQEQVIERMLIGASPEDCYEVLTAFEHYGEWAADVKSVHVDSTDAEGRASVVRAGQVSHRSGRTHGSSPHGSVSGVRLGVRQG